MTTRTEIPVVYAVDRAVIPSERGPIKVDKGSHWPAADPLVKARPDLFSDDPRWGMLYTVEPDGYHDPIGGTVETATAAPGEKRNTPAGKRG